jgi:hypothetical protein
MRRELGIVGIQFFDCYPLLIEQVTTKDYLAQPTLT